MKIFFLKDLTIDDSIAFLALFSEKIKPVIINAKN
jgi:hypothetical protein